MTATTAVSPAADVIRHYDTLLARHYTWMAGGTAVRVADQRALFETLGLRPCGSGRALDLGCGSGFQSLALAALGYRVTAVDTSAELLRELDAERGDLPIETRLADIREVGARVTPGFELAVCMGDTLTHLPSKDAVTTLLADIRALLEPGGSLVLSYRDLSAELTGIDRFIPVRSDTDRIMTCFLEYEADTVIVHDLVHTRHGDGWTLEKSRYRKLRLALAWLLGQVAAAGLRVRETRTVAGMAVIVAGLSRP